MTDPREPYGRLVHDTRLACEADRAAAEGRQRFRLGEWEERDDGQRELDMRIGSAVAARAVTDAKLEAERMRAQLMAFAAERDRTVRELKRRASRAVTEVVRDALLFAAEVVLGQERSDEKGGDRGH